MLIGHNELKYLNISSSPSKAAFPKVLYTHCISTVSDLYRLTPNYSPSDLKGPGTSKLDWRYFEHNKVDRNEF